MQAESARSFSHPQNLRKAVDGHVTWATDRRGIFTQAFGPPGLPNLVGQCIFQRHPDREDLAELFHKVFKGEGGELLLTNPDGSAWQIEAHPMLGRRGRVVGVLGTSWRLVADVRTSPRERVWDVASSLDPAYRVGDSVYEVVGEPGAIMARSVAQEEFLGMDLRLISDSGPYLPPRLRLVP